MEWINVNNRLPENNSVVIAYEDGWIDICDYNKEKWGQEGFWLNENGGEYNSKIEASHWMPLPEPPK